MCRSMLCVGKARDRGGDARLGLVNPSFLYFFAPPIIAAVLSFESALGVVRALTRAVIMDLSILEAEFLQLKGTVGTSPLDTIEGKTPEEPVVSVWSSTSASNVAHVSLRGLLGADDARKTVGSPLKSKPGLGLSISAPDDHGSSSPSTSVVASPISLFNEADSPERPSKFSLPDSLVPAFTQWEPGMKA